jgi:hypothetical protein
VLVRARRGVILIVLEGQLDEAALVERAVAEQLVDGAQRVVVAANRILGAPGVVAHALHARVVEVDFRGRAGVSGAGASSAAS